MAPRDPPEDLSRLERGASDIVAMICREDTPARRIDAAIADLRTEAEAAFPGRPEVFELTYARRFRRLRTRFQPRRDLL